MVKEAMKSTHASVCSRKLKSKGVVDEVENKIEKDNQPSIMDKVLIGVIAAQMIGLAYLFFGM